MTSICFSQKYAFHLKEGMSAIIFTSQLFIAEADFTIVGTLDSATVIKKPYISTYFYFFKTADNKSIKLRHFQLTSDFEVGLYGNCHLEIGSEYRISMDGVQNNNPENSRNIYSKVMDCYKIKFNDNAFESALNKFLSDKKSLKRFIKKEKFDDSFVDIERNIFQIKEITPCPSQDNRSHR